VYRVPIVHNGNGRRGVAGVGDNRSGIGNDCPGVNQDVRRVRRDVAGVDLDIGDVRVYRREVHVVCGNRDPLGSCRDVAGLEVNRVAGQLYRVCIDWVWNRDRTATTTRAGRACRADHRRRVAVILPRRHAEHGLSHDLGAGNDCLFFGRAQNARDLEEHPVTVERRVHLLLSDAQRHRINGDGLFVVGDPRALRRDVHRGRYGRRLGRDRLVVAPWNERHRTPGPSRLGIVLCSVRDRHRVPLGHVHAVCIVARGVQDVGRRLGERENSASVDGTLEQAKLCALIARKDFYILRFSRHFFTILGNTKRPKTTIA